MVDDYAFESLRPPAAWMNQGCETDEAKRRSLDDLLAEVFAGAYWHDDYYIGLPTELRPWESALNRHSFMPQEQDGLCE